jgi:O-palmitoleoyl-L-serine hydrolase
MAGNCEFPKYFLSDSKSQCIDGTRAVYYLRAGTGTGISKWHIHFEGGGWCYDLESCHYRSTTKFGSSKEYEECFSYKFNNSAYFSSNETENPLLHNYNMVYVRYCDGGSFAGNDMQRYQVISKYVLFG